MYRLPLLLILAALLLAPPAARAQATEPVGTVSASETEVSRAYDNPSAFFDDTAGIMALGSIERTEEDASRAAGSFATIFADSLTSGLESDQSLPVDVTFGEMVEVPVATIGDETIANRVTFSMSGTMNGEYAFLTVRQGTWVQVLVGFGIGDVDVMGDLVELASALSPRWPSDEPISVRDDGIRTGGIWAMTPLPEDLPDGFEIDPNFEEGPGAGPGTGAPQAATPVPGEATAPVEPTRDLPLIPTETPETPGVPAETPVATEAPATTVAPEIINPRLAMPFDVTIEIFLSLDRATVAEDGSCSGTGLLDGLSGESTMTLREASTGEPSVSAPMSGPGIVAYDTVGQEDVCYLTATLTDVPARAEYTLLAGDSVLGRYTYEDLSSGEPILIELGGE